uniref:4-hydroxyphenylpyruvate dioxygenase n=1 Tax=Rhabditophanes sp. KR3021 TaxID=114890 RepID=A0AC35TWG0_9BILA
MKIENSIESSLAKKFRHVEYFVCNAIGEAYYYCVKYGFCMFAEKHEEGIRQIAVRNGTVILIFTSKQGMQDREWNEHIIQHGDSIKDVAFEVENLDKKHSKLKEKLGSLVSDLSVQEEGNNGFIKRCLLTNNENDLVHSFVDSTHFKGIILPGFKEITNFPLAESLKPIKYIKLDHVVQNHREGTLQKVAEFYTNSLKMSRLWSIDDSICHSEYSAMNAWLIGNEDHQIQMTITEPVSSSKKGRGQIQEFLDFHGGPGIQHMALKVEDIVETVEQLIFRGVEFLTIPDIYYDDLLERLSHSKTNITEDFRKLKKLGILVDFDDQGYLLQIFTKPVSDRPTLFLEIIQRHNFNGFGAGNFKSLFEAIEHEQRNRGTLF